MASVLCIFNLLSENELYISISSIYNGSDFFYSCEDLFTPAADQPRFCSGVATEALFLHRVYTENDPCQ